MMRYVPALIPTLFVLAGNLCGGVWAPANMVFTLVVLVLADFIFRENTRPNPAPSTLPDAVLLLAVLAHTLSVVSLLAGIGQGRLSGSSLTWAAISTGLNSGLSGISSAHELIHRKSRFLRNLGIWNLCLCLYAHFYIEHRLGHHARVGTPSDPATARKGEMIYLFWLRTIPGQWLSALRIESSRLTRTGRLPYGPGNFVVLFGFLQALLLYGIYLLLGSAGLIAFAIQAAVAIVLLEYVNYIEHYGLLRKKGEPLQAFHSWQSDSATSRFTLFELSRHSHHHLDARMPFSGLQSFESPYFLPFGYFGMFYIALFPPLWFYLMDKRLSPVR